MVLDPFCGSGTTSRVAHKLKRRFCYIEKKIEYVDEFKKEVSNWYRDDLSLINFVNTDGLSSLRLL